MPSPPTLTSAWRTGLLAAAWAVLALPLRAQERGVLLVELPVPPALAEAYHQGAKRGGEASAEVDLTLIDAAFEIVLLAETREVTLSGDGKALRVRTTPFPADPSRLKTLAEPVRLEVGLSCWRQAEGAREPTLVGTGVLASATWSEAEYAAFRRTVEEQGVLLLAGTKARQGSPAEPDLDYKPLGVTVQDLPGAREVKVAPKAPAPPGGAERR